MWLALSDADEISGGMRMIPGSHKLGQINHETGSYSNNVLLQSQTVQNVDESQAVLVPRFVVLTISVGPLKTRSSVILRLLLSKLPSLVDRP